MRDFALHRPASVSAATAAFAGTDGEAAYLASTLIVIDVTLAALFWAWGADEDILARLVKKTLFAGVFAYLIGNWNHLARIIFESFSGLGLKASGAELSAAEFLQPGRIAQVGVDAGRPHYPLPVVRNCIPGKRNTNHRSRWPGALWTLRDGIRCQSTSGFRRASDCGRNICRIVRTALGHAFRGKGIGKPDQC